MYKVYDNFLNPTTFRMFKDQVGKMISRGLLVDQPMQKRQNYFCKFQTYDSHIMIMNTTLRYPGWCLDRFFSVNRILELSKEFDVELTTEIDCCFHHALPNNDNGWIHHDNAAVNFSNDPIKEGLLKDLNFRSNPNGPINRRRALAGLFYFNDWVPGDGGETQLYKTQKETDILDTISPINNRLLMFKIGSNSWHRALSSKTHRTAMVFWYHATAESGTDLQTCFLPGGVMADAS